MVVLIRKLDSNDLIITDIQAGRGIVMKKRASITTEKSAENGLVSTPTCVPGYYNEFFTKSPVATALLDNNDIILEVNPAFHLLFGYAPEEVVGRAINSVIVSDRLRAEAESCSSRSIAGICVHIETTRSHKSGEDIPVSILAYPVYTRDQKAAVYATYTDLRERKLYERQLSVFSRILEKSTEAVCIFNENGTIAWVNQTFHDLIGPYEDQWIETLSELSVLGQDIFDEIMERLNSGCSWRGDVQATSLDGRTFTAWVNAFELEANAFNTKEHVLLINDISDLRQKEERLDFLSYKDELTGLSNRAHFTEEFRAMVFSAAAEEEMALLFVDLDEFNLINVNNSHAAGDMILKHMAELFKSSLRDSDLLARYGGDEFVIALRGKNVDQLVERVVNRIVQKLKTPIFINSIEINMTVSIGISIYPQDGIDGNALIRHAEMAMADAKREHSNSIKYYNSSMRELVRDAYIMKTSLRNAIRDGEIYLAYQPIVHTATGRVMGMEALARWQNPRLGLVSPTRFIPVAEEADLIGEIGEFVVSEACCQLVRLKELGYGTLFIAVNVSAKQLKDKNFITTVARSLAEYDVNPKLLEIEVTESVQVENVEASVDKLNQLKAMGLSISIDDFGTGYSSMAQLSRLPLDKLKIDKSFITDMNSNLSLIGTIIGMAQNLRLKVVAEGVETEEQYLNLKESRCDFIQGYYFSKPLSPEELLKMLEHNSKEEAVT